MPSAPGLGALLWLVAVSMGLVSQAGAQEADWDKVVAAAKQEKLVNIYSTQPPEQVARAKEAFAKKYPGININFARMTSGAMVAKLEQESGSGVDGADIIINGELPWLQKQAEAGALHPFSGPAKAAFPAEWIKSGSIAVVSIDPLGFAYNTSMVPTPPKTVKDLFGPAYKNRLGASDLVSSNVIALYDQYDKQDSGFLRNLKAQSPKLYSGSFPGTQAVASGESIANVYSIPAAVIALKNAGAPIDFVSGGIGAPLWMVIPKWSKRPNAAKLFADFLISREGQEALLADGGSASALPDVKGAYPFTKPWNVSDYPIEKMNAFREQWSALFR